MEKAGYDPYEKKLLGILEGQFPAVAYPLGSKELAVSHILFPHCLSLLSNVDYANSTILGYSRV